MAHEKGVRILYTDPIIRGIVKDLEAGLVPGVISTRFHNTMIALQKADVSFQLLMQIRNKVVSAYETVMRMQI